MVANASRADVAAHPAKEVPWGMPDGLPISASRTGRHFDEAALCRAVHAVGQPGDRIAM